MITTKLADTQAARIVADQMGAQYAEYARRLRAKDPQTMTTAEVRVIFAWVASTFDTLATGCRGSEYAGGLTPSSGLPTLDNYRRQAVGLRIQRERGGETMPRISTRQLGFKCPKPGCAGFMFTKRTSPSATGKIIFRRRKCRVCSLSLESREVAADWDSIHAAAETVAANNN